MAKSSIYTMTPRKVDQLISWSACLVLIVVDVFYLFMSPDDTEQVVAAIVVAVIAVVTSGYTFATSPQCIVVDNEGVGIRQRVGGRFLPKSEIKSVEWYDKDGKSFKLDKTNIRVVGNGGMFGYTGRWRNKEIGNFHIYARALSGLVLFELTDGKKVVVSCDEPQALVDDVMSRINRTPKL